MNHDQIPNGNSPKDESGAESVLSKHEQKVPVIFTVVSVLSCILLLEIILCLLFIFSVGVGTFGLDFIGIFLILIFILIILFL